MGREKSVKQNTKNDGSKYSVSILAKYAINLIGTLPSSLVNVVCACVYVFVHILSCTEEKWVCIARKLSYETKALRY